MKRYIVAGVLIFLIILSVSFPARVAYQWFAPPDLQLSGISGSIWSGSALEGLAGGAYIRDIKWRFMPAALLSGKLAFDTSSRPVSGTLDTKVGIGLNGSLTLSGLSGSLPLDLVHPAFQQNGIRGDLNLQFDEVIIENGLPVVAIGEVTIANFYAPELSAGRLGNFRADFQMTDDVVTANVEDVDGVLEIAGVLTLSPDRSYSLIGDVKPGPAAPPSIEQQLRNLGSTDERGMRPFRLEGIL